MILNCPTWDSCEIRERCQSKHFPATSNPCKGACLNDPAALAESYAEMERIEREVAALPGPSWEVATGKGWASISIWPTKGWIVFRWEIISYFGLSSHVSLSGPEREWIEVGQRNLLRTLRTSRCSHPPDTGAFERTRTKLIAAIEAQMRPAPKQMEMF
jgi:hypothetical protein